MEYTPGSRGARVLASTRPVAMAHQPIKWTARALVWVVRGLFWLLLIAPFVNAWFEYGGYSFGW